MKPNNLLDGIQTDIKIQKGLKLLEFGTQFYLQRAYLRNCPITASNPPNNTKEENKKRQEQANAIAQLNDFLINPTTYTPRISFSKVTPPHMYSPSPPLENKSKYSPQSAAGKSRAKLSVRKSGSETPQSREEMTELDKVIGAKEAVVTPKVTNASTPSPQLMKKREQAKQNLSKKIAKISQTPPKAKQPVIKKSEKQGQEKESELSISLSSSSSKKGDPSKQIMQEQLPSYHSSIGHMSVIREVEESNENYSGQFRKQKSKSGYNLSDFSSIKSDHSSLHSKNKSREYQPPKLPQKIDRSAQADVKSQHYSFLDNTISQIKQSADKTFISESRDNQTELNLLKEISESFADQENLKYLLKMENFEMEEKYLLQRMEKRFQTCSKDINGIRSIDWSSLEMPNISITFKRPNYAHCLETLK